MPQKHHRATLLIWFCLVNLLWGYVARSEDLPVKMFNMEKQWTIVDDSDQEFLFGILEDLVFDEYGNIYILDTQLDDIKVFSSSGKYVKTIGRDGDGPGEFRSVGSLAFLNDGSLGVSSKMLAKIQKISPSTGEQVGVIRSTGFNDLRAMINSFAALPDSFRNLFVAVFREPGKTGKWEYRSYLSIFEDVGVSDPLPPLTPVADIGILNGSDLEEEEYYWIWDPWTIDTFGRIVMAPYWGHYRLRYFDNSGSEIQRVEFPSVQRERTELEKSRFLNYYWGGQSPESYGVKLFLSQNEAIVRSLYARPDGRIWVRTSQSGRLHADGVFMELDCLSPSGEKLRQIRLVGPGDESLDRAYFGPGNRMVVIHGAEGFIRNARGRVHDSEVYDLSISAYNLEEIVN